MICGATIANVLKQKTRWESFLLETNLSVSAQHDMMVWKRQNIFLYAEFQVYS